MQALRGTGATDFGNSLSTLLFRVEFRSGLPSLSAHEYEGYELRSPVGPGEVSVPG
jgi:hypothetical protein